MAATSSLIKTVLEYLAPARFDYPLHIGIRVARLGCSSLSFAMGIWRDEQALTSGEVIYVHADSASRLAVRYRHG